MHRKLARIVILLIASITAYVSSYADDKRFHHPHKNITVLEEFQQNPGIVDKAKIRLRFKIDDVDNYDKLNIIAVDLCNIPVGCERVKELSGGAKIVSNHEVIFGHAVTKTGIKGSILRIVTKKKHRSQKDKHHHHRFKLAHRSIKLDEEINFDQPFGYDFFIDLKKVGKKTYKANYLAHAPTVPSATNVVFYNPEKRTRVEAGNGMRVVIPAYALNEPTIFSIEGNRTTLTTGSLIIDPGVSFLKPIEIKVKFDADLVSGGNVTDSFSISFNGQPVEPEYLNTDKKGREVYSIKINEAGHLLIMNSSPKAQIAESLSRGALMLQKPYKPAKPAISNIQQSEASPAGSTAKITAIARAAAPGYPSDPCVNYFNSLTVPTIYNRVDTASALYYNACQSIAPYLHVVIYGVTDERNTTVFSAEKATSGTYDYKLKKISDHAAYTSSWAMINSFTWDGDVGVYSPATGYFLGTQYLTGALVGSDNGAEVAIGFTDKIGGYNWVDFFDKPASTPLSASPYDYNLVSSTSSVIKNGVCNSTAANPGDSDTWSAMGVRYDSSGWGYIVMMSSASGKYSTPFDLCQVFKALDVPNAIRLDGGSATSLYVNGSHVNPIGTYKKYIFGSARHIINGIGVK